MTKLDAKKETHINRLIIIYILFILMIVLSDTIFYFCNADYLISIMISLVVMIFIYYRINKSYQAERYTPNIVDIVACAGIVFFFVIRISIPDYQWDTLNYHGYLQENFGESNIDFNFFPSRTINTATLPLGDRMFYIFRYLLGFRVGTILNLLVRLLIYFQIKDILFKYFESRNIKINKWFYLLLVIPILIFDDFLLQANSYYIDMLSLPLFIEIIRMILFSEKQSGFDIALIMTMAAATISIKISNGYVVLVLAVLYLIKFRKCLSIKPIIIGLALSAFTVFVYFYVNYKDTLNPIYPYLNDIFKSPYFITGVDMNEYVQFNSRFGPETLKQYLLWPIYVYLVPGRGTDFGYNSGRLIVSMFALIVYIVLKIRKNKNRVLDILAVLFIALYIIYLFPMQGYSRYIPILDIVGGILTVALIVECFMAKKDWLALLSVILCMLFGIQVSLLNSHCFPSRSDYESVKLNAPYLFVDRESGISEEITDQIDYLVVLTYNASSASAVKDSVPIIMPYDLSCLGFGYDMPQALRDEYDQIVQSLKGKRGFVPVRAGAAEGIEEKIEAAGLTLIQIIPVNVYFFVKPAQYYLYEVEFQ